MQHCYEDLLDRATEMNLRHSDLVRKMIRLGVRAKSFSSLSNVKLFVDAMVEVQDLLSEGDASSERHDASEGDDGSE